MCVFFFLHVDLTSKLNVATYIRGYNFAVLVYYQFQMKRVKKAANWTYNYWKIHVVFAQKSHRWSSVISKRNPVFK